jgi:hypothetical protein
VLRANGQYPGLTNAAGQPLGNAWLVYTGPAAGQQQVETACTDQGRKVHSLALCTTHQPARQS